MNSHKDFVSLTEKKVMAYYGAVVDSLESSSSNGEQQQQQQHQQQHEEAGVSTCALPSPSPSPPPPLREPHNFSTQLAADRTYMAADRTAIAWVRTAISMIGFGVTIAKTADVLQSEGLIENSDAVKIFGIVFVGIAWLGLVMVIWQNIRMERRLAASGYGRQEGMPLGLTMAVLVFLCGVLGGVVIFHPIH